MPHTNPALLEDLIARVAKGDRRAFDALYETTSARLNALCLSLLRDRREAEESLEQVYVQVWRNAIGFAQSGLSPMAWLAVLTRQQVLPRRNGGSTGPVLPAPVSPQGDSPDPLELVRAAWLEGLGYPQLAARVGMSHAETRHLLHEGLERLSGHAADDGDSLAAAEQALGLRPDDAAARPDLVFWQERLARFADDLTPVMAPARARQRIRESLGHGAAPLSVDPLERKPWWRGPWGVIAVLLIAAAAWYVWAG